MDAHYEVRHAERG